MNDLLTHFIVVLVSIFLCLQCHVAETTLFWHAFKSPRRHGLRKILQKMFFTGLKGRLSLVKRIAFSALRRSYERTEIREICISLRRQTMWTTRAQTESLKAVSANTNNLINVVLGQSKKTKSEETYFQSFFSCWFSGTYNYILLVKKRKFSKSDFKLLWFTLVFSKSK